MKTRFSYNITQKNLINKMKLEKKIIKLVLPINEIDNYLNSS